MRHILAIAFFALCSIASATTITPNIQHGLFNVTVIGLQSQTNTEWTGCWGYAAFQQWQDANNSVEGAACASSTVADFTDPGNVPVLIPFDFVMLYTAKNPQPRFVGQECIWFGTRMDSAQGHNPTLHLTVICADG